MIGTEASGVTRRDEMSVVTASAAAKCLRFAAAPTFTIMALLTVVFDNEAPNALCTAAAGLGLSGMAPMYLLMAAFHLGPWLTLISRPSLRAEGRANARPMTGSAKQSSS